jgi:hypothetical protein
MNTDSDGKKSKFLGVRMPRQVVKRWFNESDGETPSLARETRAIPILNGIVTGETPQNFA